VPDAPGTVALEVSNLHASSDTDLGCLARVEVMDDHQQSIRRASLIGKTIKPKRNWAGAPFAVEAGHEYFVRVLARENHAAPYRLTLRSGG
jgi:hypothetical protein